MSQRIHWDQRARADLRAIGRQDRQLANRIVLAVETLAEHRNGDVRKLQGRSNEFRLRVGDWRVMFSFVDGGHVIVVSRVLNRRDAYRD